MKIGRVLAVLAIATLPFFASCVSNAERQKHAERVRIAKEVERKRVAERARIAKDVAQKRAAEEAEQARIAKEAARKRAEEEAKARAEEEKRLATEQEKRRQQALVEARKKNAAFERQLIRERFFDEVFSSEGKLSEEERSRGWTLLTEFGETHMPRIIERCATARRNALVASENFRDLVVALKAENSGLETNDVFQAAKNRWLDLSSEYWWLRYKLTDNYSAFKVGALTADELDAKDKELAELLK